MTNEKAGTLTVIDAPLNRIVATLALGKRPRGAFLSTDGRTLYVALSGSPAAPPGIDESALPPRDPSADGIGIVDLAALKLVKVVRGVSDPERVVASRDGKRLYVASEDTGTLVEIDIASGTTRRVAVGEEPEGIAIAPDDRTVFVGSEGDGAVAVVDTERMAVLAHISAPGRPRSIALARGGRGFVATETAGEIVAFDARLNRRIGAAKVGGLDVRPMGVAPSPDGRAVFVTTGRGGTVVKFDAASLVATGSMVVGQRPWGVAVSPDGRLVYTANGPGNDLSVVDARTMTVAGRIGIAGGPWDVVAGSVPK